jgi:type II secretory ATPase GspE/PulE/Tfp pilus assembly ATPase PilB-like protein
MPRLPILVLGLFLPLLLAGPALAQETGWPIYPLDGPNLERGPGGYLSPIKLLAIGGLLLLWCKTTDWVNWDSQVLRLPHSLWNAVAFFPFLVAFFLALLLPFLLGYSALVLSWLVPLGIYIYQRNANVEPHEKVLTADHLRFLLASGGKRLGMKVSAEKQAPYERGAPVHFAATAGDEQANQACLILARQSSGFVPAKEMVADLLQRRGDRIMLDSTEDGVAVRYQIDGVWHETDPQDAETGAGILTTLRHLAGVDPQEAKKRQAGQLELTYEDVRYTAHLVTQGTRHGQRAILQLTTPDVPFESISELGMRDKMRDQLKELLASPRGLFLFSAIPSGGLTTTMLLAMRLTDRYMRDFLAFQDVDRPEPLVDNVERETYDTSRDAPDKRLQTVLRKEPDVLIVHELLDANMTEILCRRAGDDKLIIASIRAKEAVEALLRVLLLKVSAKVLAPAVIGVLNQRLIRKLCESCKEAYPPPAELLKKLGIPAGRVESLYRPPERDEKDPVCSECGGIGYLGRTAIYELLVVDDTLRTALIKEPKLEVLRRVARKTGHKSLQEEGILLVVRGITSLPELNRVLKQ